MRAVLIKDGKGPIENLYVGEAPEPVLRPGQVMVKIKSFGLNRMDIIQREGRYPPPPGSSDILGVEFSGSVSAVSDNVSAWKVGDEVFGIAGGGAYAEYIAVESTHLLPKPSHLSWNEAASIPEVFLTAYQAIVMYCETKKDDHVLIHAAASGVGIAAIQLARINGAQTVTATASTREKLDWLLDMPNGATHAVNYKTQNFAEETKKITENHGVDVIVDFVGQSHWKKNLEAFAKDGRMTLLATLSGNIVSEVNIGEILYKRLRIQGSTLRSRSIEYQADLISRFSREVLPSLTGPNGEGPIKTYIHKVYSWKNIQEAHRDMEANINIGKLIVEVD
ncbi:quinone oxidoreductase putative [Dendrothele bispora CBS 962.96]|uniref:Quinone oxidoreductase putative n=1 Tax=Dendrothele bispora (strain CBS 962.96) TaxID=1314807 RepID=A0A4S8M4J1_DENBC|nr:quinone oxidoreductase putative [Dendrothele bispora CBS 962.96]